MADQVSLTFSPAEVHVLLRALKRETWHSESWEVGREAADLFSRVYERVQEPLDLGTLSVAVRGAEGLLADARIRARARSAARRRELDAILTGAA